jgi:hypothetical protein
MRRLGWHLPRVLILMAILLGNAGSALAYVSTTGAGTAPATVATIVGPSGVATSQTGTNITVSWNAATLSSGSPVQGYRVSRSDGASVCGSPTLVTTLSCTDNAVPAGTYTYTVTAIYNSWDAAGTSSAVTALTAPSLSSSPPSLSTSSSASFSFSGGNGGSYTCQLDGGASTACASPASYSGLSQGSHTFKVSAVQGSSTGPVTSYTWTADTIAPTQGVTLASGASNAYLSGATVYYASASSGSFKLVDAVSDGGSGPASATFPSIATTGWTHGAETVTTPSGGPYTSSTFSWSANPSVPAGYSVTGADAAGNSTSTSLTFVRDTTAPSSGALTVNGTVATGAGSTSSLTNSTSFPISSRTDYTDAGSGLRSSVLTVQSESLSGSTCGALGTAGPFTSATTISGTTQPSGIQAGYCYVYTLTGTDNVGNVASLRTTIIDNSLSFTVTTRPPSVTAGVATASTAVVLTATKNGATDPSYTGSTLTWSGASNSPTGTAPTLPASPTWSGGSASFGITLVTAETETLTVTDGTRSATFAPIVVNPGAVSQLAWTNVNVPGAAGLPSECSGGCNYSGFGNGQTASATVSIIDSLGNVVTNVGSGHTVVITIGGSGKGSTTPGSPATLTIPSSGPATTTGPVQYTSVATGNYTDTLTATSTGYTGVTATISQ